MYKIHIKVHLKILKKKKFIGKKKNPTVGSPGHEAQ